MNGQKIKQQADAILHILDDVTEIDRFNVLFFDDRLTWFKSNAMIGGSPRNIEDAKAFVKMTYAKGGKKTCGHVRLSVLNKIKDSISKYWNISHSTSVYRFYDTVYLHAISTNFRRHFCLFDHSTIRPRYNNIFYITIKFTTSEKSCSIYFKLFIYDELRSMELILYI